MATGWRKKRKKSKHLKHKLKWIRINFEQIELKCFYEGRTKNKRNYLLKIIWVSILYFSIIYVSKAKPTHRCTNPIQVSDIFYIFIMKEKNKAKHQIHSALEISAFWQDFVSFCNSGKSESEFIQRNSKSISFTSAWYVHNSFPP